MLLLILAREVNTNQKVAIKLEVIQKKRSLLKVEVAVYQMMKGEEGFPRLYWSGTEGDYNIIAIELLGTNLENLMHNCGHKFSVSTSFSLAIQMVLH
jgi:predicted Ser/Thr protein kinase